MKEDLNSRQQEIIELAAQGLSNGEIASRIGLKPQTIRQYMYLAYKRLGLSGDAQAKRMKVLLMIQRGEI